ncbi:MAG: hypothetical protein GX979_01965 [Firmicutes bacterium]|nr:hypothetical protein [Bacillota bacterium]
MRGWPRATVVLVLAIVSLIMSGCLFGGAGEIQTLELTASHEVLGFGETAQLSAVGKTKTGKKVAVIADWEIIKGSGTLVDSGFRASSWNYEGPVVLRATYQTISAEITLTINGLLGEPNPFPKPSSIDDALPKKTDPILLQVGEPVSVYAELVPYFVIYPFIDLSAFKDIWSYFVRNGTIQPPELMEGEKSRYASAWIADDVYEELLPEIPSVSHQVHFELIETEVLPGGASQSRTITYRHGTTLEQASEMFYRLVPKIATSYGWGWSNLSGNLGREIQKSTQESVTLEPEEVVSSTWSFVSPDDADFYLHSAWVRVDTFYLSDSEGNPLDTSVAFAKYGFSPCPVEIRGDVVYVTWSF